MSIASSPHLPGFKGMNNIRNYFESLLCRIAQVSQDILDNFRDKLCQNDFKMRFVAKLGDD
jgi:hypothetical protein